MERSRRHRPPAGVIIYSIALVVILAIIAVAATQEPLGKAPPPEKRDTSQPPDVAMLDLDTGVTCVVPLTSAGEPAGMSCDWNHPTSSAAEPPALTYADDA